MQSVVRLGGGLLIGAMLAATAQARPTILITGYWPPTNEMLRPFSPNPAQNGGSWAGENWENRGYDVKSYFPEFPDGFGRGSGDFEVDYQDTIADFRRITDEVKPVAIITFSRANTARGWEMEPAHQRWRISGETNPVGRTVPLYAADYSTGAEPTRPTDPTFLAEPIGNFRYSNLPMQAIVDDVGAAIPAASISPFIDVFDPASTSSSAFGGNYLSGFMGYLGTWYRDQHSGPGAIDPMYFAGHIHVGMGLDVGIGTQATEITLRRLMGSLDQVIPGPGSTSLMLGFGAWVLRRSRPASRRCSAAVN